MAVTHSAGAKKAMREAVSAMRDPVRAMIDALPTHKVIAYIACASGPKAVVVDAREGDDVRSIVMEREQGKHGGGVVYLAHERQEDALFARSAMQGAAREDFIRQRVSYLRSMHETQATPATPAKRVLKAHPLSDEAEAASRAAVRAELEDGAYGVERNMRTPYWQQQLAGEFISRDDIKIDPSPTPFMQHAMKTEKMTRKQAEGLYGTSMAEFAQQAMRGADFERKLEQVRKDQEELCGIKVNVDPAVGCDDFVIYTPARQQGKSWYAAAAEKLWGKHAGQWIATVHDEVMHADPSALRDAQAMARGTCKPQNKPHKDEKPANPYPPAHPRAEPPAGLMAVSDMSARMGNRWAP